MPPAVFPLIERKIIEISVYFWISYMLFYDFILLLIVTVIVIFCRYRFGRGCDWCVLALAFLLTFVPLVCLAYNSIFFRYCYWRLSSSHSGCYIIRLYIVMCSSRVLLFFGFLVPLCRGFWGDAECAGEILKNIFIHVCLGNNYMPIVRV